ncbi:MAG: DUF4160 domain-containing protein [Pseudomonadota bacterium]|nr:DUF4160 domain-containing protein [Pseudomonadota bacterium]
MPVVFRDRGRRFHFYSDEGSPREPNHIQVSEPGKEAEFWLFPAVRLACKTGIVIARSGNSFASSRRTAT